MERTEKVGLLLINLGTPESPATSDVRRYLREFLSDPRVIDIAAWKRWLILNLFILPLRPRKSAEAYRLVWTEEGSPLLIHGRKLAKGLARKLGDGVSVELAMRYGSPSIGDALARLRSLGVGRVVVFPLYPQYSSSTTGSTLERVYTLASELWNTPYLQVVPPFYDHPAFINAFAESIRPAIESSRPERVYFSFHGLPERQVRKGDPGGAHCLEREDCCERIGEVNRDCYRAQCYATARLLAERLGLSNERVMVCFQSRLGRDPWLRPYTDEVLAEEARRGTKRGLIASPAFVADCLETLEELGMRGAETWKENGGETLTLAPCPNASEAWLDAAATIARDHANWLPRGPAEKA